MTTESVPDDLDLGAPWCLTEPAFAAIVDDLRDVEPLEVFVEFGSGRSSVRFAQALPDARIFSIESAESYHQATVDLVQKYHVVDQIEVSHRPLRWQSHGGGVYLSYGRGDFPESVDAVLIDGPPGFTKRGREACLHQVLSSVRVGGRIYLDDFARPGERKIVRNWLAAYPGIFDLRELRVGHHVAVLEKMEALREPPARVPVVAVDTVGSAAIHTVERAIERIKRPFTRD